MNIRVTRKKLLESSAADVEEVLEDLEAASIGEPVMEHAALANRRMARFAYYSASASIVAVILFAWLASWYVIALETRIHETTAVTLQQMETRVAKLEDTVRPKPLLPRFVEFTVPDGAARLGSASAPVTIVEFADFQCPYCARFHESVYAQLRAEYVDTGKASFVYQDYAFLGEESQLAAEAAKCAGEQGKFWEYHDYLFTHQQGENEGAFTASRLKAHARAVQLRTPAFNTCLDSGKYRSAVEAETASGRSVGVTGTPTIIINGRVLVGALPYSEFKKVIDAALAK